MFRPTWVRREGVVYKAFLISGSDGLDPLFVKLDELLVIGGSTLLFVVILMLTANKSVMYEKYDNNVYHAHRINDKLHVSLKHYFL